MKTSLQRLASAWNTCFPDPSDILDKSPLKKPTAAGTNAPKKLGSPPQLATTNTFRETRTCQTAAATQSKKLPQRIDTASSLGHRLMVVCPAEWSSTSQSTAHCAASGARFFPFMLGLSSHLLALSRKGCTRHRGIL